MPIEQLKAYTKRALELETAIYTQKRLMDSYTALSNSQAPKEPVKKVVTRPEQPNAPDVKKPQKMLIATIVFIPLTIICAMLFFIAMAEGESRFLSFLLLAFDIFCTSAYSSEYAKSKDALISYEVEMDKYKRDNEAYTIQAIAVENNYQYAVEEYHLELQQHNHQYTAIMDKHNSKLQDLETALQRHYELNVIFPKYREIVAIASINEYLESGRCDKLEGANGAYNLYENELRQNIVIGQLSTIISNMEMIRSNQYSLYQELTKANNTIDEIISELRDIRSDTKLIAHFSHVTALAAVSPRYTITRFY